MQKNYTESLKLVLRYEGGYTNDPRDPGGPTNFGVIQTRYDQYRRFKGLATQTVKLINQDEVAEIYKKYYADPVKFEELPAGLDFTVFDYGVNSGPSKAAKDLQRVLGFSGPNVDGFIGIGTLDAALQACQKDAVKVITDLCEMRMAFLKRLNTFDHFGVGWTRRVMGEKYGLQENSDTGVIEYAVKMARDSLGTDYVQPEATQGKAEILTDEIEATLVKKYVVKGNDTGLNLRAAPFGDILQVIPNGTKLLWLDYKTDWYKVALEADTNVQGWVVSKFVMPEGSE